MSAKAGARCPARSGMSEAEKVKQLVERLRSCGDYLEKNLPPDWQPTAEEKGHASLTHDLPATYMRAAVEPC